MLNLMLAWILYLISYLVGSSFKEFSLGSDASEVGIVMIPRSQPSCTPAGGESAPWPLGCPEGLLFGFAYQCYLCRWKM